jgi:hypothetical protein
MPRIPHSMDTWQRTHASALLMSESPHFVLLPDANHLGQKVVQPLSRACYTGSPFSATFHRGGFRIRQFEPYDEPSDALALQVGQPRQTEGRRKWGHGITRSDEVVVSNEDHQSGARFLQLPGKAAVEFENLVP